MEKHYSTNSNHAQLIMSSSIVGPKNFIALKSKEKTKKKWWESKNGTLLGIKYADDRSFCFYK
jgi:hypothetical protein